jgi:archaemetzincin
VYRGRKPEQLIITLVPVGAVDKALPPVIGEDVSQALGRPPTGHTQCPAGAQRPAQPPVGVHRTLCVDCVWSLAEPLDHPAYAYNARRRQYLSSAILKRLRDLTLPDAERCLGIVDLDLYVPDLNFVFGQASLNGHEAVIALPRLRQSFYGLPDDEALFHQRAVKEAIHELGHTYGLRHCPDSLCVMHFSNSLHDTDVKSARFCQRCHTQYATRNT